tara:strand:+ start:1733 stop:1990 length:258 start_codon:yes stop_codon:yes gene_type:complete
MTDIAVANKMMLESEKKTLIFLINKGSISNKALREKLLQHTIKELEKVEEYLINNCVHEIIEDYIDIDEKCIRIKYCNNCGLTLR